MRLTKADDALRRLARRAARDPALRKKIVEHVDRSASARNRIGATPEDRLRWVLNFIRRDLDALRPGELMELGYDLRALKSDALPGTGTAWRGETLGPLGVDALRSVQRQIVSGLQSLLGNDREWSLGRRTVRLWRMPFDGKATLLSVVFGADRETDAILSGVAALALQAGRKLRMCPKAGCRTAFLSRRRQDFCSTECAQYIRNERKKKRREQEGGGPTPRRAPPP